MSVIRYVLATAVIASALLSTRPAAQAPTPSTTPVPATPPTRSTSTPDVSLGELTPLKIQVTISRYQGDRRISSLPYMLSINSNDRSSSSLRIGAQVPVTTAAGETKTTSSQYLGTSIDCSARTIDDGRYRLSVSIDDSSIDSDEPSGSTSLPRDGRALAIRSFRLSNSVVLRDGQSTQFTTALDRLSGETVKVDVALTVVK